MATIRKRGNFQWQAAVRRQGHTPILKTFRFKRDAESWARETESELERGTWIDRTEIERTTLQDALARYLKEVTPKKKGWYQEGKRIQRIMQHPMAQLSLSRVRSSVISEYRDERLLTVKPATVNLELAALSHMFNTARKEWGMEGLSNPVELVKKPTVNNARTRRLEYGEYDTVIAALSEYDNPWLVPLFILAVETAMRKGELLALQWEHIDLVKRTAHLPHTKNGNSRTVPLSSKAVKTLAALPRSLSGQVFATNDNATKLGWIRSMKKAGIDGLRFHDLRHEATSRLADIFAIHELAKITGHKDTKMLLRYYHPRAEDLAKRLA